MKKKEFTIIAVMACIAIITLIAMRVLPKQNTEVSNHVPKETPKGEWVAVIHRNAKVLVWFDSGVDDTYDVTGDYGKMTIEVKDGRWHVLEVECPNQNCKHMGWRGPDDIMQITCLPNNITILTSEWVETMLDS